MNQRHAQLELVQHCLDGEATGDEVARLEELLRNDPEFRLDYLRYVNVDSALAVLPNASTPSAASTNATTLPETSGTPIGVFVRRRSLAAAGAAGLVIGLACASVVWAIVYPRKPAARDVIPILSESFESPATPITEGFPTRTGVWGGDRAERVGATPEVRPLDGDSVLSLESSPDSNLGYLQQIVDVSTLPQAREGQMRVVEVIASFHADQPGERERYTLRVASFKESPEKIRSLWEGVTWRQMDRITLTFSKTGLSTPVDAKGWQTLSAIVEVPADARSVVISLAAGRLNRRAPKTPHYVDDVRAELRVIPFTQRLRPNRR